MNGRIRVRRWLIPELSGDDPRTMVKPCVFSTILFAVYGFLHDQVTYSISTEYFTKLKFDQFAWLRQGNSDRAFAGTIGFVAAGIMGWVMAWFLVRCLLAGPPHAVAMSNVWKAVGTVMLGSLLAAVTAFLYGCTALAEGPPESWLRKVQTLAIVDQRAFVHVAYIHNGSYLGGAAMLVMVLLRIKLSQSPRDVEIAEENQP